MPPILRARNLRDPPYRRPRPAPDAPLSIAEIRRLSHAAFPLLHAHLQLPRPLTALYSSESCLTIPLLSDLRRTSPEHAAREVHLLAQLAPHGRCAPLPSADTALAALHALGTSTLLVQLQTLLDDQIARAANVARPAHEPLILAGDCHEIRTYHRKHPRVLPTRPRPSHALPLAVGTKPDRGTALAYRFLTLTTTRGAPLTVAALPFLPLEQLTPKLDRALADAQRRLARRPDLLLYDAAAYGTVTLRFLQAERLSFIVRAPQSSRTARLCREHAGLLCFLLPNFEIRATQARADSPSACFTLVAVSRDLLDQARVDVPHTERTVKWFLYATNLVPEPGETEREFTLRVALLYKERWDVETGYRGIEEVRGFTHSLSYDVRLLQFFLAVILANLWAVQRERSGEAWTQGEVALFLFAALLFGFVREGRVVGQELQIPSRTVDPSVPLGGGHHKP